jgi:DMSO/TMAO reductase YedYZ molybdopterin-dependent catalytic subunit/ribosomal protein L7/L12
MSDSDDELEKRTLAKIEEESEASDQLKSTYAESVKDGANEALGPSSQAEETPANAESADVATEETQASKIEVIKTSLFITVKDCLVEKSPEVILRPRKKLDRASRRDFLIYGAGMAAAVSSFGWLLPGEVKLKLGLKSQEDPLREKFLSDVLKFDDSVSQALFSKNRLVPTYSKADMTEVPNNFAGQTPDKSFIPDWKLMISGLAGGIEKNISSSYLRQNLVHHEQITRLVCVEGWSAISWWGGLRFADFIKLLPPQADTKWIQLRSAVNLDGDGNSDPYFVSLDLDSALHPQTLLVTHHNGQTLELEHGAPLRLLAPMKLGLKNIKAITSISYSSKEPDDYWNKDGYSYYDGI